jgi:hypothetical protein
MLNVETSYTNKTTNETVELKTPKMKVMGKLMENNEKHRFVVLTSKGVRETQFAKALYPSYSYFVKIDGDERDKSGLFLDLSKQVFMAIKYAKLKQFDVFEITKGMRENKKSGALNPVVIVTKINVQNEVPIEKEEGVVETENISVDVEMVEEFTEDEKSLMDKIKTVSREKEVEVTVEGLMKNMQKYVDAGKNVRTVNKVNAEALMVLLK